MPLNKETKRNQDGTISSLNDKPLQLVDRFIDFGSNISSTESGVKIHVVKVLTAIQSLSTIWKSDISD